MKHFLKPARTKKSYKEKSFSPSDQEEIFERDQGRCRVCLTMWNLERHPHHIFFRSELYRDIINWKENAATVCQSCHAAITNPTDENRGRWHDRKLKGTAIEMFQLNPEASDEDITHLQELYKAKYGVSTRIST